MQSDWNETIKEDVVRKGKDSSSWEAYQVSEALQMLMGPSPNVIFHCDSSGE